MQTRSSHSPASPSPTPSDRSSDERRQFSIQSAGIAVGLVYQAVMAYATHFHAHHDENDDSIETSPSPSDHAMMMPCAQHKHGQRVIINPPPHCQWLQRLLEWRSKVRACELAAEAEANANATNPGPPPPAVNRNSRGKKRRRRQAEDTTGDGSMDGGGELERPQPRAAKRTRRTSSLSRRRRGDQQLGGDGGGGAPSSSSPPTVQKSHAGDGSGRVLRSRVVAGRVGGSRR